jgi:hypothetical protein
MLTFMFQKAFSISGILMFLIFISCSNLPLRKEKGEFSEFQGKYTWKQANALCKSMNMRLPTLDELKVVYDAKQTKDWQQDGNYYWTQSPASGGGYFVFIIAGGSVFYNFENEDYFLTRCFKSENKGK